MDGLLAKLAGADGRRRRLVVGVLVGLGLLALGIAIVVSATGATGGTSSFAVSPRPRSTWVSTDAPTPTPTAVLVQVVGAVRHPGLVSLPAGARAVDAITAAGGPTARADQSGVNLAAPVVDGQQLVVPERGATPAGSSTASSASVAGATGAPVQLSSATEAQLEALPRIGPSMAARIIAYRTAHGPFRSVDDLASVSGIGPKTLAGLRGFVVP